MATKPPSMCKALDDALRAADLDPVDRAAIVLAKHYAACLDADPAAIVKVGHMVLPVLTALGFTPAARKAVAKGSRPAAGAGTAATSSDPISLLRAERRSRAERAAASSGPPPEG